ncbi:MAG TPA: hypothetical protein VM910_06000 [Bradyrhizobium sp.]|nr:hypothetical protein [Bradyrhizobium sp.]
MKRWTLKAMMIVGCADGRERVPTSAGERRANVGDTAQAGNRDKFRPKPTGNADGGEPFRGSWRWGKYSSSSSLNCEMMRYAFRSAISHPTAAADDGCVGGVAGRAVRLCGLAELPP